MRNTHQSESGVRNTHQSESGVRNTHQSKSGMRNTHQSIQVYVCRIPSNQSRGVQNTHQSESGWAEYPPIRVNGAEYPPIGVRQCSYLVYLGGRGTQLPAAAAGQLRLQTIHLRPFSTFAVLFWDLGIALAHILKLGDPPRRPGIPQQ